MSRASHTREEIRKELLPYFEKLVDAVYRTRHKGASMQAENTIATAGDALSAKAIGQWLLSFDCADDFVSIDGKTFWSCPVFEDSELLILSSEKRSIYAKAT